MFHSNENKSLRLGFIGLGWIGRNRLEAILDSEITETPLVFDTSPTVIKSLKKDHPTIQVAESIHDFWDAELDGIVIATPNAFHLEHCLLSLENNLPVFCQKPLGRNSSEIQKIVEKSKKKNLRVGIDWSYRFTEAMVKIKNLISEKAIGDIFSAEFIFHNAYGPNQPWFYDSYLSGGGCLLDLGVHLIDLAFWTLQDYTVKSVSSSLFSDGKRLNNLRDRVEDFATLSIDLKSGVHLKFDCSWKLNAGCDCDIRCIFYGTQGTLVFKNIQGSFYDFSSELLIGRSREILTMSPDSWGGKAAISWAKHLKEENGRSFDPELENTILVAQMIDQAYGRSISEEFNERH